MDVETLTPAPGLTDQLQDVGLLVELSLKVMVVPGHQEPTGTLKLLTGKTGATGQETTILGFEV